MSTQNTLLTAGEDSRANRKPIEKNAAQCVKRDCERTLARRKACGVNGEVIESLFEDAKPQTAAGQVSLF